MKQQLCCCIIGGARCERDAEWVIVHGPAPDDYTESCGHHIADLLTDAAEHRVYRLHTLAESRAEQAEHRTRELAAWAERAKRLMADTAVTADCCGGKLLSCRQDAFAADLHARRDQLRELVAGYPGVGKEDTK